MPFFVDNKDFDDELLDEEFDMDSFNEACVYMEWAKLPDEERKAIVESEEAAILEAKGKISRKTIVRLNRADDMERRTTAAAYQMAKDKNDPLWTKLVKALDMKKKYKSAIVKKYGTKAQRVAKQSQKDYLKHPASKLIKVADLAKTREK